MYIKKRQTVDFPIKREEDEVDYEADLGGSAPADKDAKLLRSMSNLERVQAFAGPDGTYHDRAVQLMVAQDPGWIDREALKQVMVNQRKRLIGCLSLPFSVAFFLLFSASAFMHEDITYVYIIESGIRKYVSPGLDEVESIPDVWEWLNTSLVPKLFKQEDLLGRPIADKSKWSKLLSYNQLQGPILMEQLRSGRQPCSSGGGLLDDMECYPLSLPSTDRFGRDVKPPVAPPSSTEYASINVTLEERMGFYDRAFGVEAAHQGQAAAASRRLRIIDYMGYNNVDVGGGPFEASIYPNTPYRLIQEQLNYLYLKGWLDKQSTQLVVKALLLNREVGRPRLEQLKVLFFFSRGGDVLCRLKLESLFLVFWSGIMSMGLDMMWLTMLIIITAAEVREVYRAYTRGALKKKFSTFWTLLEWVIVVLGWSCVFGMLFINVLRQGAIERFDEVVDAQQRDVPADENTFGLELHSEVDTIINYQSFVRYFIAEYHLVLMFRFFTAFRAQPRLGIVVGTLESSIIDIIHFFIVLLPTFMAYAISGCFIFGRRLEEFSTYDRAVGVCFKMLMEGEYDWPELSLEHYWTSLIWTWSFMLLLVLLMLNMVLAIIMDIYTDLRRRTGRAETVWETFLNLCRHLRYWKVWISMTELKEGMEKLPRLVTREEMLETFPGMCEAQLNMLITACDKESATSGGMEMKDSIRMVMGVKLCIDAVDHEMQELHKELHKEEDVADAPFKAPTIDRGWRQEIAERMAVQNHHMLALQWQLQQLQWQWKTVEALTSSGVVELERDGGSGIRPEEAPSPWGDTIL